jgi:hypothetical protein
MPAGAPTCTKAPVPPSVTFATAIARPAAPGLPLTKYVSPELPAEATTTTPARAAASEASAVVSLGLP